jgi:hypothetical protein
MSHNRAARGLEGPMNTRKRLRYPLRLNAVAALALLILLAACASTNTAKVRIDTPATIDLSRFGRVLVAGFLPDGTTQVDLNEETAGFVRMQLRSKTLIGVIDSEPLQLADSSSSPGQRPDQPALKVQASRPTVADVSASKANDAVFTDATFWRRLGEEYSEPLILTGTITFKPLRAGYAGSTTGPSVHLSRAGFGLKLRLVLIDGRTGEVIESDPFRQVTARATTDREGALSVYFRLMDQMLPSILEAVGQKASQTRVLLR